MTSISEKCQINKKNEDGVDYGEISTSIMVRSLLTQAARIRHQRHTGDDPGSHQPVKSAQLPSTSFLEVEGWEGEESQHDEAWYLEQAVAHLITTADLAQTQSDGTTTTRTTEDAECSFSVSSVRHTSPPMNIPPTLSPGGFSAGLDVGACFVAHARLAQLYHQRGTNYALHNAIEGNAIHENTALWYEIVKTTSNDCIVRDSQTH